MQTKNGPDTGPVRSRWGISELRMETSWVRENFHPDILQSGLKTRILQGGRELGCKKSPLVESPLPLVDIESEKINTFCSGGLPD